MANDKKIILELLNLLPRCHGQRIACNNPATHEDDEGGKWCDEHATEVYKIVNEDFGCRELKDAKVIREAIQTIGDEEK